MPREIEFYERDGQPLAGVHYGDKVYVALCEDILNFCEDVSSQIRAHLTQRALDAAGRCACGLGLLPDRTCPMHFQYITPRK